MTTDVQAPNGLNIEKEYDAVKENEKVYADTKDVVSSPENREVTGKILEVRNHPRVNFSMTNLVLRQLQMRTTFL